MTRLSVALLALGFGAVLFAGCASKGAIRTIKAPAFSQAAPKSAAVEPVPVSQSAEVLIRKGDCLWRISRKYLGRGARYPEIYALNALKTEVLQPGQKLRLPAGAGAAAVLPPRLKAKPEKGFVKRPNRAYTLGEKLTFAVQYAGVTGGYATLSVTETVEQMGRSCLHIQATAKTNAFFDTFYKVRDVIDSYIDTESIISWRYEKHTHEGPHTPDNDVYLFDQRAHKMSHPVSGKQIDTPADVQDVLSCFYWFRTLDWKVGDEISIPVASDEVKNYELKVNVLKKERVSCLAGDFDTVLVQPHLKSAGVFQQKGEVFIWITDDARHIPVKIQSKIALGSININLQDAEWVEP
jgi:LysM repeat protein